MCAMRTHWQRFTRIGAALAALTATVAFAANIDEGIISYWTNDANTINGDVLQDTVGDNDGQILGAKSVPGHVNEALAFEGGAQHVRFTPVPMAENITITAWLNPDKWNPVAYSEVLDTWAPGGGSHWYRLGFDNTGLLEFVADTGDAVGARESVIWDAGSLDGWHHVAGVRDFAAKTLRIYVDAAQVAERPFAFTTEVNPQNLVMGMRGDATAEPYYGVIDEVGLFNTALEPNDLQKLMTSGLDVYAIGKTATIWARLKRQ